MNTIPHIIHQTHKSKEFIQSNKILLYAAKTWINTGYDYRFYDDNQADEFMKTLEDEFPDIHNIYNRLPIPVMKADFFRYCVVYKLGGIYADADTVLINEQINKLGGDNNFICVAENKVHVCQWIFSASPKCSLLKKIIEVIINKLSSINIKDKIKETRHYIHDLTGPAIFTYAIREYLLENGESLDAVNAWMKDVRENEILSRNKIVMHPSSFHKNTVRHLFSGQWSDGWCEQASKLYTEINHNHDIKIKVLKIISDYKYPDTFKTSVNGYKVTIKRTDTNTGWGQTTLKIIIDLYDNDGKVEKKEILIGSSAKNTKDIIIDNYTHPNDLIENT
jgi:mannosyltransferase OCH1-like enzyme